MMKKLALFSMVSIFMLFMTSGSLAQGGFNFHFGPSIPLSDFSNDDLDDEDAGGAGIGFTAGFEYLHSLNESGLGMFIGFDGSYNPLTKSIRDDIEKLYKDMGLSNAEITFWRYINLPLSAGLSYTIQSSGNATAFFRGGLVANFLKTTNFEVKVDGEEIITEFDWGSSIGFKIGGGVLINEKMTIALDYYGLGEHDISGTMKFDGASEEFDVKQKVCMLTLTLGFKL